MAHRNPWVKYLAYLSLLPGYHSKLKLCSISSVRTLASNKTTFFLLLSDRFTPLNQLWARHLQGQFNKPFPLISTAHVQSQLRLEMIVSFSDRRDYCLCVK